MVKWSWKSEEGGMTLADTVTVCPNLNIIRSKRVSKTDCAPLAIYGVGKRLCFLELRWSLRSAQSRLVMIQGVHEFRYMLTYL